MLKGLTNGLINQLIRLFQPITLITFLSAICFFLIFGNIFICLALGWINHLVKCSTSIPKTSYTTHLQPQSEELVINPHLIQFFLIFVETFVLLFGLDFYCLALCILYNLAKYFSTSIFSPFLMRVDIYLKLS